MAITSYHEQLMQTLSGMESYQSRLNDIYYRAGVSKVFDATRSIEEKMQILENHTIDKEVSMYGFQRGYANFFDESGYFYDPNTGERLGDFRLSDFGRLDVVDSYDTVESNRNKSRIQPTYVSELVGKSIEDLTEFDYDNVKNYQTSQILEQFTNPDYTFTPFDRNTIYNKPENTNVEIFFRQVGTDSYGRSLIEAISPTTGRQVSFDTTNNPYLNVDFSLRNSLDTPRARQQLHNYETNNFESLQAIKEAYDTDGRIGETIDMIQADAYRAAGRVLQHIGSDEDKEFWRRLASEDTGYYLSNAIAGVRQSSLVNHQQEMSKASDLFDQGDFGGAIFTYMSQIDRIIAQSAVDIGFTVGAVAAGTAISIASGGITVPAVAAAVMTAMPSALNTTLRTNEVYRQRYGESMSADQLAVRFAINTALLAPGSIIAGLNIAKAIPAFMSKPFQLAYHLKALPGRAGIIGLSMLEEFAQENIQSMYEDWSSFKYSDSGGLSELFKSFVSSEGIKSGLIGALVAGTLSGSVQGLSLPGALIAEGRATRRTNAHNQFVTTHNVSGGKLNDVQIATSKGLLETIVSETNISTLDSIISNTNNSVQVIEAANAQKNSLILQEATNLHKSGKTVEEINDTLVTKYDQTLEGLYTEFVHNSDPYNHNAPTKTGITKEETQRRLDNAREVGKSLGLDEDYISKTLAEVQWEVINGTNGYVGYKTYLSNIDAIDNKLANVNLSEEERTSLLNQRNSLEADYIHFFDNQIYKLSSIQNALTLLLKNVSPSAFAEFKNTPQGGFTINRVQVAENTSDSNIGFYALLNAVTKETKALADNGKKVSSAKFNEDTAKEIEKTLLRIQKSIQALKDNYLEEVIKNTPERQKPNASKLDAISIPRWTNELIKVGKGRTNRIARLLGNLNHNHLKQIESYINNSKDLSDTDKEHAKKTLETLYKHIKESKEVKEKVDDARTKIIEKANKDFNDLDTKVDTLVTKFDDTKGALEIRSNLVILKNLIGKHIKDLSVYAEDEEAKALLDKYNDLNTELEKKIQIVGDAYKRHVAKIQTANAKNETKKTESKTDEGKSKSEPKVEPDTQEEIPPSSDTVQKEQKGKFALINTKLSKTIDEYKNRISNVKNILISNKDFTKKVLSKNTKFTDIEVNIKLFEEEMYELLQNTQSNYKNVIQQTQEELDLLKSQKEELSNLLTNDYDRSALLDDLQAKYNDLLLEYNEKQEKKKDLQQQIKDFDSHNHHLMDGLKKTLHKRKGTLYNLSNELKRAEISYKEHMDYPIDDNTKPKIKKTILQGRIDSKAILDEVKAKHKSESTKIKALETRISKYENQVNELYKQIKEIDNFYVSKIVPLEKTIEIVTTSFIPLVANDLLDSSINNSANLSTFSGKNNTENKFNLSDEVKAGKAGSLLGIVPISLGSNVTNRDGSLILSENTNELINYVLKQFESIKPNHFKLAKLIYEMSVIDTKEDKVTKEKYEVEEFYTSLESNPAARLLYNFRIDGDINNPETKVTTILNPNVAIAIDTSIGQYFSEMSINQTFNPTSREDIAKIFGVEESEIGENYKLLRDIVKKNGIPKANLIDNLGKLILFNLGIHKNPKGTYGFYERLVTDIGNFALIYANRQGFINITQVTKKASSNFLHNITEFIKPNSKSKAYKDMLEDYKNITSSLILVPYEQSRPHARPTKVNPNDTMRNTYGRGKIPEKVNKVLQTLHNTQYNMNKTLFESLYVEGNKGNKNLDWLKDELGYMSEKDIENLPFDLQDSQRGINQSIDYSITFLEEYNNDVNNEWYFDWFMSKNGRLFIDSNTVNPQSDKLHRFLFLPKSATQYFNIAQNVSDGKLKLTDDTKQLYFAIAQAFDNLSTKEKVYKFGEEVMTIAKTENLLEHLKNGTLGTLKDSSGNTLFKVKDGKVKYESLGQAINAIDGINTINKGIEQGLNAVAHTFMVENDSTTSGYAIRFAQMPLDPIIDTYGEKVGYNVDSEMFATKAVDGFLDIYKTMASKIVDYLPKEYDIKTILNDKLVETWYKTLSDVLPKPDINNETGLFTVISSELRTLFKSPSMVFGYTAGKRSLKRAVARELIDSMLSDYVSMMNKLDTLEGDEQEKYSKEIENTPKLAAIKKFFNEIKVTHKQLKTTTIDNIWLDKASKKGKNLTLRMALEGFLADTYGQAVWDSLSDSFKAYENVNDSMNTMVNTMFSWFKEELNYHVEELHKQYGNKIPIEEYNKAVDKAFEIAPALRLFYSDDVSEGMLLLRNEKVRDNNTKVVTAFKGTDGKTKSSTAYGNIREFSNPRKAGAVIPIHFIDGMTMAMLLAEYGSEVIPVHDAIVANFQVASKMSNTYNEILTLLNKEYNVYDTIYSKSIANMETYQQKINERLGKKGIQKKADEILKDHKEYKQFIKNIEEHPFRDPLVAFINSHGEIENTFKFPSYDLYMGGLRIQEYGDFYVKEGMGLSKDFAESLNKEFNKFFERYLKRITNNTAYTNVKNELIVSKTTMTKKEALHRAENSLKFSHFTTEMNVRDTIPVYVFIEKTNKINGIIEKGRNTYFRQWKTNGNMDGGEGSLHTIDPSRTLTDYLFEKDIMQSKDPEIQEHVQNSEPGGFKPGNLIEELYNGSMESIDNRIKMLEALNELHNEFSESDEHLDQLKHVLRLLDFTNLKNMTVDLFESEHNTADVKTRITDENVQIHNIRLGKETNSKILDPITRRSPYSSKSLAELYAHEMTHASMGFALNNINKLGIRKTVEQLQYLQKIAMDVLTPLHFMPDEYHPSMEKMYRNRAEEIYNHIFMNDNKETLYDGLQEFIAYGLTNRKVVEALKRHELRDKSGKPEKFLDRLLSFAKSIFDVIFGRERFSEVFKTGTAIVTGSVRLRQKDNLYNELEDLFSTIQGINSQAKNQLFQVPLRIAEAAHKAARFIIDKGDRFLSPLIKYGLNWVDELGLTNNLSIPQRLNLFNGIKFYANIILLYPFSSIRRKRFHLILTAAFRLSQQGLILSLMRDFAEPDAQTNMLLEYSSYTRMAENASKLLADNVRDNLLIHLERKDEKGRRIPLTESETKSLTTVGLFTDISSLIDFDSKTLNLNVKNLIDMIKDTSNTKLESEIGNLRTQLSNSIPDKRQLNYYLNQINGLSLYMVEGIGNPAQVLNARAIAYGIMSTNSSYDVDDNVVNLIDKLVSLNAIKLLDNTDREVFSTMPTKGIENFLLNHDNFKKETIEESVIESFHIVKGYTRHSYDNTIDIKMGRLKDQSMMTKSGYKLITDDNGNPVIKNNTITGENQLVMYKKSWTNPQTREGTAFVLQGQNAFGFTLENSAYANASSVFGKDKVETKEIRELQQIYISKAQSSANILANKFQNREYSVDEIRRMSNGYLPVIGPNGVSDFRLVMSNADKVKHLGMELDGISNLTKMYSSKYLKVQAPAMNKALIEFLKQDQEQNMDKLMLMNEDLISYVKISKDTDNKFLLNSWKVIPKELKDIISKKGKDAEEIYIREDWLQYVFGMPTASLADNKIADKIDAYRTKFVIRFAEFLLKQVAVKAKDNIIIKNYRVLTGNMISNFNYSVALGTSPSKVAKLTFENFKHIRNYLDMRKELGSILHKQKLGTASDSEIRKIHWYRNKMETNPIHPLMQRGLYQSIVEDLSEREKSTMGASDKYIRKITNKLPKFIRDAAKHMDMGQGTLYYDTMFQLTQYSDFVARAVEYQVRMEKAPEKYEIKNGKYVLDKNNRKIVSDEYLDYETTVVHDIMNAFINYDRPQPVLEQYLNDIGLVMFTKFFKRIQHVITKGFVEKPLSSLLFILFNLNILDVEDITEQHFMVKNWTGNIYNVFTENIPNAIVPYMLHKPLGI